MSAALRMIFSAVLSCACAGERAQPAPSPVPLAPHASASASSAAVVSAPLVTASVSAPEPPPITAASMETACAEPGDSDAVVAISKLDACPPASPSHQLNCQGSYDGWSLWYGSEADAIAARRAGCPTAIVCRDPRRYRQWSTTRYDALRTVIDRAEARALPKSATRAPSIHAFNCMM